nr:unnamed protein product [Naegleria fowleri]
MVHSTTAAFNNKKRLIVEEDISQFDIHFEALFDYGPTLECFTRYLKETMNTESSEFLASVNEFRKMKHERKRMQLALKMYDKFIADQASSQLNLRRDVRMKIHNVLFPHQAVPLHSSHSSSLDQYAGIQQQQSTTQPMENGVHSLHSVVVSSSSSSQEKRSSMNNSITTTTNNNNNNSFNNSHHGMDTPTTLSITTTSNSTTMMETSESPLTPPQKLPMKKGSSCDSNHTNDDPAVCTTNNNYHHNNRHSIDSSNSSASSYTNSSSVGGGYSNHLESSHMSSSGTNTTSTCPKSLFDEVESQVLLQLKENHFVAFLESDFFKQFLKKQPLQVLYEIGTLKCDSVLQMADALNDTLRVEHVTLQDFKFVKNQFVSNNPNDWELIGSNSHYKCFLSTKTYDMGESEGLHFFKFHVTFPYHVSQVMSTMFEMEYRRKIETHLTHTERVAYLEKNFSSTLNSSSTMSALSCSSSCSSSSPHHHHRQGPPSSSSSFSSASVLMSSVLVYEKYKLVWPLTDRDFVTSQSGAYDATTSTYYLVMKGLTECQPSRLEVVLGKKEDNKNVIRGLSFGGCAFREVSPTSTEYSQLFYMDLKGRIPKQMIKAMIKDRAKEFTKIGTKLLQHNETFGFKVRNDNMVWKTFEENGTLHL